MPQNNSVQVFEGGWKELENAIFTSNQTNIATNPESHFVRPDGTSVSVISATVIETFPIGLPRYDPDQVGTLSDTFTITDDTTPIGHCWNDNGTELYIVGQASKTLYQFNVPAPYTPSSIVAASVSLDLVAVTGAVLQCVISRDGDFIFITDGASVFSFPLPVKDDITSFVLSTDTVFTPGGGINVDSFAVKLEGDKIYTGDTTNNLITEYVTTAPNIIVGATANGNTLLLPSAPALLNPNSITFRSNGKQFFVLDRTASSFTRIHLDNINWNISTASYFPNFVATPDYQSIFWKPDGTKFHTLNSGGGDRIDETPVDDRWNMNEGVVDNNFSLTGIANTPRGIWVSSDGLTCFVTDANTADIVQLNMSTGWDLTTMTDPSIRFDLGGAVAGLNFPNGVAFSKDQLTYYITDSNTDTVYQFTVASPLAITTSTFTGNSLDLSGMGDLVDIRLRPDDNLMYVCTRNGDFVRLFSLPSDGNVSNAVFLQELDVSLLENNLQGIFIRENDGKKMWLVGLAADGITCLDMTSEFNNALITNFGDEITTDAGVTIVTQ